MSQILQELFSGVLFLFTAEGLKTLAMFIIAFALIYLAIKKEYEPSLLLPPCWRPACPPPWATRAS